MQWFISIRMRNFALVATLIAILAVLPVILLGSTNFDNRMDDQFVSVSDLNKNYVLTVLYSCFAHTWLALVNRTARGKNPINLPSSREVTKKLAIVTGSNTGIGFETAKRLVREYGWDVILACRSKDKALAAKNRINDYSSESNGDGRPRGKAIVLEHALDLSDFDSIRKYADALDNKYDKIDVLINNAGLNSSARSKGNPELNLMFQSNYLGHFLLTELLLKNKLLLSSAASEESRSKVINLSSVMHHFSKGDLLEGDVFESIESENYWKRRALFSENGTPGNTYSASKLAAILHSAELNRRYGEEHLTAIAVNPGGVNSDIWRGFPMWVRRHVFDKVYLTTEEGSEPIIAAAIRNDWKVDKKNIIYLQPYVNPFSVFGGRWFPDSSAPESGTANSSVPRGPMTPFTEMIGPYVGHLRTIPRLPTNTEVAARTLWKVSEELTKL